MGRHRMREFLFNLHQGETYKQRPTIALEQDSAEIGFAATLAED